MHNFWETQLSCHEYGSYEYIQLEILFQINYIFNGRMKIKSSLVGYDSDCEKRNYEASLELGTKHTGKLSTFFFLYTILLGTRFTSTTAFDSRRPFLNKLSFHIFFPIYFLPFLFSVSTFPSPHRVLSVP